MSNEYRERKYKDGKYTVFQYKDEHESIHYTLDDEVKLHREEADGPAVIRNNGTKFYCLNGKYHRLNGPACDYPNGQKEYYIHGRMVYYYNYNILYDNWLEIPELNYIGPYKQISSCFIELPIEIKGHKHIRINK